MKKIISILLTVSMLVCLMPAVFAGGGSGSEGGPVLIGTVQELINFANEINGDPNGGEGKFYKLTADIDLGGAEWAPIGYYGYIDTAPVVSKPFKGTFDGDGHTISNYTVKINEHKVAKGLFAAIGGNAVVKNVGVENARIILDREWIWAEGGALVGVALGNAKISGCYSKDCTIRVDEGLTYNESKMRITYAGGILARTIDGSAVTVENCYTLGLTMVGEEADQDGAIAGRMTEGCTIRSCYTDAYAAIATGGSNATVIENVFYTVTPPWPFASGTTVGNTFIYYCGTQVDENTLKTKASDLGSAYSDDIDNIINGGFPVLKWELDERFGDGDARVIESAPADGSTEVNIFELAMDVKLDRYLNKSTFTKEAVIVTPEVDFELEASNQSFIDGFSLKLDTLTINTEYTVSFADTIKTYAGYSIADTVSFRTIEELPGFVLESTTPASGSVINGSNAKITASFNLPVDTETLDVADIEVSPSAAFTVSGGESEKSIVIAFTETLAPNTAYTVTFRNTLMSTIGSALEETSMSFTTMEAFGNLVKNPDMEDTRDISLYYNDNPIANGHFKYVNENELKGEKNSVLYLDPGWADEPAVANGSVTKPGTYYTSAWVKSEAKHLVKFSYYAPPGPNDGWGSGEFESEANKWIFYSSEFTIGEGSVPKEISIRSGGKFDGNNNPTADPVDIWIDDWSIYDVALAPSDNLVVESSSVPNGASGISPVMLEAEIEFNVPVRQDSLLTGIKVKKGSAEVPVKKISFDMKDLYKCRIVFDTLENGTNYTIDLSGVKSIAGKTMESGEDISFRTVDVNGRNANVTAVSPSDGDTGVKRTGLEIVIDFDSPINPDTVSGIGVTPDLGAKARVDVSNIKRAIVTIDESKYKNGQRYTVSVPETVKTLDNYSVNAFTSEFTAITDTEALADFNAALGDSAAMETAFPGVYSELGKESTAYESVLVNYPELAEDVYEALAAESGIDTLPELQDALNEHSLKVLLGKADSDVISDVIENSGDILSSGVEEIYGTVLTDNYKNRVINDAVASKNKSYAEIKNTLAVSVITNSLKCVGGPSAVKNILNLAKDSFTGTNDITSLLNTANSSPYSTQIYGKLQGIEATDLAQIKTALRNAINTVGNKPSIGGGGGGAAGGGGGGGAFKPSTGGASIGGGMTFFPGSEENTGVEIEEVFTDLESVLWAKNSIVALHKRGLVNGKGGQKFAPKDKVTRAELVKMAVLATGAASSDVAITFEDVSPSDWSYKYIVTAYGMNLINGISETRFGADNAISRQDMAVILARMAKNAGIKVSGEKADFSDIDTVSDYAKEAVSYLSSIGIINGIDGKFVPNGITTRAEAAVVFDRFLTALEEA